MNIYAAQNSYLFQQQKQLQLAEQMKKYNSGIADYNMHKLIRFYTAAINSAETSDEAKYLAESLNSLLSKYGQSVDDVDGITNPLLNDPTAAGKKAHGQKGNAQDKAVIADLSEEFGIDVKKRGTTKDWLEKAKNDDRVRILDKNGKDITAEREGRIKQGDILEIKSKKHGLVKISCGGDGEINGRDDKVIAMGGKVAANGIFSGLNDINNTAAKSANNVNNTAAAANPIFGGEMNPELNELLEVNNDPQTLFTQAEIKNLLAAILNNALSSIEQKEYQQKLQGNVL